METNPYSSPRSIGDCSERQIKSVGLLRFRYHFPSAILVGIILSNHAHQFVRLKYGFLLDNMGNFVLYFLWGNSCLWFFPINFVLMVMTFACVWFTQLKKVKNYRPIYSVVQIGSWWGFWLLFGCAGRFGLIGSP